MTSMCHTHACTHPNLRVQLERQISTHEETLGKAVRNAARRIEYKHHLTAIGVQGARLVQQTHASTQWQGLLT